MLLAVTYLAAALVIVPSVLVVAERVRQEPISQPGQRVLFAVVAGLLWPLLVAGVLQLAAIIALRKWLESRQPAAVARDVQRNALPYEDIRTLVG